MNAQLAPLCRPLLLLVGFTLLPQLGLREVWITALSALLVGYRFYLDHKSAPMPPRGLQWLVQLGIAAAIWQYFHSFLGDEAGGSFLTLLMCAKTYELKQKRDFFVTALLCLMVLMSYLLLEQGLLMTLFLIVDTVFVLAFLYALETDGWQSRQWKSTIRSTLVMGAKALPLLVVMFVLFPRFSTGFGSNASTIGTTGVTDSLRPGAVSKLVSSSELVFRATFLNGAPPPKSQLYWRGAVLDQSHGMNWERSKSRKVETLPLMNIDAPDVEIYLEPGSDRFLFSQDHTQAISFPNDNVTNRFIRRDASVYELVESLQTRERYYARLASSDKEMINKSDNPTDFLEINEVATDKLKEFLKPFRLKPPNESVRTLLEVFRKGGYSYSMQPPPSKNLDDFLFRTKIGFCEHFAGTFATLLRHLNIPARVVVGFQGGTPSILDNYISVRGHDAHAWVEYYDANVLRWRRLDPTAQVAPLRLSLGSSSYYDFATQGVPAWMGDWSKIYLKGRAFLDEVEASWIGFMLRFDLARQKLMLAKLGMEGVFFRALAVFLILALFLVLAVIYFIEASRREPLSVDEKLYRRLLKKLERRKVFKLPSEGPLSLMNKVALHGDPLAREVEPILLPIVHARYGRTPLTPSTTTELRRRLRQMR